MTKPKVIFHRLKMSVPNSHGFKIIRYADILWLQADKQYTQLILHGEKTTLYIYESLSELENQLPLVFFRCHRSVIVNLCTIESINKHGVYINNRLLPVSQKNKTKIRYFIQKNERLIFPLCKNCDNCDEFSSCEIIRPFTFQKNR